MSIFTLHLILELLGLKQTALSVLMGTAASQVIAWYRRPGELDGIPMIALFSWKCHLGLFVGGYCLLLRCLCYRDQGRLHAVERLTRFLSDAARRTSRRQCGDVVSPIGDVVPPAEALRRGFLPWLEPDFINAINVAVPDLLQPPASQNTSRPMGFGFPSSALGRR